jgi:hypothetical protein
MKTRGSTERRRERLRERAKHYYATDEDKEKKKKAVKKTIRGKVWKKECCKIGSF